MIPQNHSAPGLKNGLDIIELLAKSREDIGFNIIDSSLPVSRATTARLLAVLQAQGWVIKDGVSGKYRLGSRPGDILRCAPIDLLKKHGQGVLDSLADITNNTCLLIYFDGTKMECAAKAGRDGSVHMQDAGTVRIDLSHAPWGWIFYRGLSKSRQRESRLVFQYGEIFDREYETSIRFYERNGFLYESQCIYDNIRRMAAPITDVSGNIIGAIGMGAHPTAMKISKITHSGRILVAHAGKLSAPAE